MLNGAVEQPHQEWGLTPEKFRRVLAEIAKTPEGLTEPQMELLMVEELGSAGLARNDWRKMLSVFCAQVSSRWVTNSLIASNGAASSVDGEDFL